MGDASHTGPQNSVTVGQPLIFPVSKEASRAAASQSLLKKLCALDGSQVFKNSWVGDTMEARANIPAGETVVPVRDKGIGCNSRNGRNILRKYILHPIPDLHNLSRIGGIAKLGDQERCTQGCCSCSSWSPAKGVTAKLPNASGSSCRVTGKASIKTGYWLTALRYWVWSS